MADRPVTSGVEALMRLAQAEFEQIHALLDRVRILREVDGEKLSASQRVAALVGVFEQKVAEHAGIKPQTLQ